MKQKQKKERNPFVALALFRVAGAHDKPYKTKRAQDKSALKKQWTGTQVDKGN